MAAPLRKRSGRYWLVQRIKRSPMADRPQPADSKLAKLWAANPFGNGKLGDYDLDYMGSAEFEWGAIPEAFQRLANAGKGLTTGTYNYAGHSLDFLWIAKEGEPFEDWAAWVEGLPYVGPYGERPRQPLEGKESCYQLRDRLDGKPEYDWGWGCDVWWALEENVMWAFSEDNHLERMLKSIANGGKVSLRG